MPNIISIEENIKKVTEWEFYSNIIKELEFSKELRDADQSNDFIVNLDELQFERFICLTGEKEKEACTLVIDIYTGVLYPPQWCSENYAWSVSAMEQLTIQGIRNWKVNNANQSKMFAELFNQYVCDVYILLDNNRARDLRAAMFSSFDTYYLPSSEVVISSNHFVNLNIWGDNFTNLKFAQFLSDNKFQATATIQKFLFPSKSYPLYKSVPTILKELEQKTGITLHTQKIIFPYQLFHSISTVSKYENFISYIDFLLFKTNKYATDNSANLITVNQFISKISNLQTQDKELQKIKEYLLAKYDFSMKAFEKKLLQFKNELTELLQTIDTQTMQFIQEENNSLWDFSPKIQNFDFNLFGETFTRLYNNQIDKYTNLAHEIDFLPQLSQKIEELFTIAHDFTVTEKEKFRFNCEKKYVADSFEKLFYEWSDKINEIQKQYLPLIQAYFYENISQENFFAIMGYFENYRKAIDVFFQERRIPLIQNYDMNPKSEFIQKAIVENTVFQNLCIIRNGIKQLIEQENQYNTKKLLNSYSQILWTNQLTEIVAFSKNTQISEDLHAKFITLQKENFEIYLLDIVQYGEELNKRNEELNDLMFRMRKDLEKSQNSQIKQIQAEQLP